eukprot:TRINITY_DN329_c0_g1_i1.p1 TRINITY_DN329_c0_g1~~TRINITY_DN329_c0_g1_i1.p1  ORF type:complete len:568 (+),score=131.27 TRINITY_DN329_c0_g1_i1:111-1814(+)
MATFGQKSVVAAVLAASADANLFKNEANEVIDGCYYQRHKYDVNDAGQGRLNSESIPAETLQDCQKLCQEDSACYFFTYYSQTKACFKLGKEAIYDPADTEGSFAGPKFCPDVPTGCTEIPDRGFPGRTPDETEMLFTQAHRQPTKLECWPRNSTKGWYDSCPIRTVLEDSQWGWPGLCEGLTARTGPQRKPETPVLPTGETCESDCIKDPTCSVWVVVNNSDKACWHGLGQSCYFRDPTFPGVVHAQRIMHGEVRVLANLTHTQIWGLQRAFDSNYFVKQQPDAVHACRNHCYSNLECAYWQYSSITGCWTEDPDLKTSTELVSYPLTQKVATDDSRMAKFIIAGEYIQHVCPGKHEVPNQFSNSFIPSNLRYVEKEPMTAAQLYNEFRAAHPEVGPAPVVNNALYGSDEYNQNYQANANDHYERTMAMAQQQQAQAAAQAAAATVQAAPAPAPVRSQTMAPAATAVVDQTVAAAMAAAHPNQQLTIGGQRLYEKKRAVPAAVAATRFSPTLAVTGAAAMFAVAALSMLALRRTRHPSMSVQVDLPESSMELANSQTDTEPLMAAP